MLYNLCYTMLNNIELEGQVLQGWSWMERNIVNTLSQSFNR